MLHQVQRLSLGTACCYISPSCTAFSEQRSEHGSSLSLTYLLRFLSCCAVCNSPRTVYTVLASAGLPKTLHFFFSLLVALCCTYTYSFWETLDILLMFMGMPSLPDFWEYKASAQSLFSLTAQHFEEEKANMLGKLQKYFLSPIYPTACLQQEAFCMSALSVLMVRAELASFKAPSLGAPFCHADSHSVLPLLWSAWCMACTQSLKGNNIFLLPASSQTKKQFFRCYCRIPVMNYILPV